MRDILFRAKRRDNKQWVQGSLLFYPDWNRTFMSLGKFLDGSFIEVQKDTVGQYTGLTDKNGKKIFEGDIVKTKEFGINNGNGINFSGYDIFEVIYSSASFKLNNTHRLFNMTNGQKFEVIGNIHDNPELLGGASDE